ncbi:MAG: sulfite exporter TauE/SafE family protein [Vicinamibacteria bacterium]
MSTRLLRSFRRLLLVVSTAWALGPTPASAHPLGNFTVNRSARITVIGDRLLLSYALDYAEIPAFQEINRFPDLAADLNPTALEGSGSSRTLEQQLSQAWTSGLRLRVNGTELPLTTPRTSLHFIEGSAGLPTFRLEMELEAAVGGGAGLQIEYADSNAPGRLGWREVVLSPSRDWTIQTKSAEFADRSRGLTNYPKDPSQALPQETSAAFTMVPTDASATAPTGNAAAPGALGVRRQVLSRDPFEELIRAGNDQPLSASVILTALLAAMLLGAAHALSPGHGKTIVGAYLVGSRGTLWHAIYLGAIVTFSHTIGVFTLGLVTLLASQYVLPERLYPWLTFISGALVALIGASLFHQRIEAALGMTEEHRHLFWKHSHVAPKDDAPSGPMGWKGLTALGISGGLVPCPSAIVVLLAAVSLHRIAFGLVLIVAFSVGLSAVLIALGLAFVYARSRLSGLRSRPGLVHALGITSALVVTGLGALIAYRALVDTGVIRIAFGG